MQVITGRASVAANTTTTDVLSGVLGNILRRDSLVRLLATGSAVGLNAIFSIQGNTVVDDQEISSANRFPIDPDDMLAAAAGVFGEQLILRFHNTTAGALTYVYRIEITP